MAASFLYSVRRLLLDVADRHGLVLDEPAPQVPWKALASDPRYMINKTLTDHGIVIAFPQRDIHLDTSSPLDVRVLADVPDSDKAKK